MGLPPTPVPLLGGAQREVGINLACYISIPQWQRNAAAGPLSSIRIEMPPDSPPPTVDRGAFKGPNFPVQLHFGDCTELPAEVHNLCHPPRRAASTGNGDCRWVAPWAVWD